MESLIIGCLICFVVGIINGVYFALSSVNLTKVHTSFTFRLLLAFAVVFSVSLLIIEVFSLHSSIHLAKLFFIASHFSLFFLVYSLSFFSLNAVFRNFKLQEQ